MSSMAIETRIHRLYTYKVYPRAHYFRKRLLNLYPRFRRVIDKFPDSLQDPALLQRIEQYAHTFVNPVEIVFMGNGALDVGAMVVDGAQLDTDFQWDHDDRYPTPTIPVCYITLENEGETGRQITNDVLETFFESETYKKRDSSRLFIRVDIGHTVKQSQLESYIKFIENTISKHDSLCASPYCLSINKHDNDEHTFGKVISKCLEIEMMSDFEMIHSYLRRFVGTANNINIEMRIIEEVNTPLRDFVVGVAIADTGQDAVNESREDTSKQAFVFLNCIVIRLKCLLIPLLSRKYGLAESLTIALLEKMQFTNDINAVVTHNTLLCAAEMYNLNLNPKMLHRHITDKLMKSLMNDLSPVITEAEAAMGTGRTIVTTVSKMIYEVGGYVDMSSTGTTSPKDDAQAKEPVQTEKLRPSIGSRYVGGYKDMWTTRTTSPKDDDQSEVPVLTEELRHSIASRNVGGYKDMSTTGTTYPKDDAQPKVLVMAAKLSRALIASNQEIKEAGIPVDIGISTAKFVFNVGRFAYRWMTGTTSPKDDAQDKVPVLTEELRPSIASRYVGGYKDMWTTRTTYPKDDDQSEVPVLTEELRHSIARIPGVYGHGVLYGKLEVHVTRSDAKVKDAITAALHEHNFHLEYNVQLVKSQPESFAGGMHEPGMYIRRQIYDDQWTYGTLGGYATDIETKEVYAITCAHVVSNTGALEQEVFIKELDGYRRLGCSTPRLCLYCNDPPHVDFAAVKVNSDLTDQCVLRWKDDDGCLQRGELAEGQPGSEAMRFPLVYKHGAKSELTYGTVLDSDYRVGDDNASVMLIQTLPGDEKPFAMPGDSGAVVCAPFVDTVDMVHTVSMVVGGEMELYGVAEKTVLTYHLSKCLHELHNKSEIVLILP